MNALAAKYLEFDESRLKIQLKFDIQNNECRILRVVSRAFLEKTPLKVRTLLDMSMIASPATIHKGMKSLISKDLISVKEDKADARVKYLVPTARTIKLYTDIGKLM